MVDYYGDFAEDDTVLIPFNTFDSNDPQASVTITNLADADIMVHKDGGLTQIATDGATVVINFDSITGNHMVTIDTSAHADYSTGSEYAVRIEGTTVDAGTINAWIGSFSIERAGGVLAIAKLIQTAVITNAAGTDVAADIIAMKAETALIVGDTGELQTDWVNGGRLDLLLDAIPTTAMRGTDSAALASAWTATRAGYVDELAAANIPADVDTLLGRLTAARAQVLTDWINGGRLDLLLDAIPTTAMRGTDNAALATALTTAQNDLDTITDSDGVIVGAAGIDLVWDEVLTGATHNVNNSSGKILRETKTANVIASGTATAGSASTITLAAGSSAIDNFYNHLWCVIVGGTGVGQVRAIEGYVGSTLVATVSTGNDWTTTPDNTSEYQLVRGASTHVGDISTSALALINTEVDTALNTAIPGGPAANSINERVAAIDDLTQASGGGDLAAILADTNELQADDIPGLIAALNDIAASDVLTQVNAALDTAISELGVAVPTATPTLRTGLILLYMSLRNKTVVQTSGTDALEIYNNAGTLITKKLLTDDGSDYTEAEMS